MMVIRITLQVLLEKQKEVMQTLFSMIGPIGMEKGCLSYQIFQDIENQNIFSLLGEWNSRKELNDHIKSDKFGVLLGTRSLLQNTPKIQILSVSSSKGMEIINQVRSKSNLISSI